MDISVFDNRACSLGEGPLWHPVRQQLFWFDIVAGKLRSQSNGEALSWSFDEPVSAAGWVDEKHLLIASASSLLHFNIDTGDSKAICLLESNNQVTRSNDGRADPWGGFWIGTMGRYAEAKAGSIYRYYQGEVRELFSHLTITNTICFAPYGKWAYFADTAQAKVWRQRLDANHGWPDGEPELYLDLYKQGLSPDGAVCDVEGRIWIAMWGSSQVMCFDETGKQVEQVSFPVTQPTCPAFGGENFSQLFVTSATQDLRPAQLQLEPLAGQTLSCKLNVSGQAEHQVIL